MFMTLPSLAILMFKVRNACCSGFCLSVVFSGLHSQLLDEFCFNLHELSVISVSLELLRKLELLME